MFLSRLTSVMKSLSNEEYDVIILGAGISGLASAQVLTKQGLNVLILEARSRIGGRIHTIELDPVDSKGWPKVTVDLGANYLHGCSSQKGDQPLFHLARHLGISTCVCAGDEAGTHLRGWEDPEVAVWRDCTTGERISASEIAEVLYLLDKTLVQAVALMRDDPNLNEATVDEVVGEALAQLLQKLHQKGARTSTELSSRENGIFKSFFSRFFAYVNPGSRLPARILWSTNYGAFIDTGEYDDPKYPTVAEKNAHLNTVIKKLFLSTDPGVEVAKSVSGPVEDRLVVSGFGDFVKFLSQDLNIKLNTCVRKVEYFQYQSETKAQSNNVDNFATRPKVVVTDQSGDTYHASHCIISLPVGVLKGLHPSSSITFSPSLSQPKLDAINRIGIPYSGADTHNKVILRFDVVFWDEEAPHLETPDPRLHILNLHLYGKPGVLCAHIWAGSGIQSKDKSDEEIVRIIMHILEGMYPKTASPFPQPIQYIVTRWSEDPFSLGSYTCEEKGSRDGDRAIYAEPVPSRENPLLLFAGEATTPEDGAQQCTHGAFQSGIEAARGVLFGRGFTLTLPKDKVVDYLIGRYKSKKRRIKRGNDAGSIGKGKRSRIDWPLADRVTRSRRHILPGTPRSDGGSDSGIASSSSSSSANCGASVSKKEVCRGRTDSGSRDSAFEVLTPYSDSGCSGYCDEPVVDATLTPHRLSSYATNEIHLNDNVLDCHCSAVNNDVPVAPLDYQRSISDSVTTSESQS